MKILIDARFYGLEHAGLGRYTINLIHELAKQDYSNEYVILLRKKHMDLELPKKWKKQMVEAKHYWFKEQAVLPLVIRKYKPDVVHFLHSNIPIFYPGKFIVTIHDMTMYRQGTDATTLPIPVYFAKRIPFKLVFRKAVYESTEIIVPSYAVKEELVSFFKIPEKKLSVIYEGASEYKQKTTNNQEVLAKHKLQSSKFFLYVGNLYPHKNIKRAIEAIRDINNKRKKNGETISLVIVSSRSIFRHRLEQNIKELNAQKYIQILDFISDDELQILYKNAIAFVFPSISEGFGLPGLEAIQSGTMLIASDIPVFREIYKDRAIYFDPHDVLSLAAKMGKVIGMKKEERQKNTRDAKSILKNYSWENMARETLNVYKMSL